MKKPLIMGIINVTPDSFSGDGIEPTPDYIERAIFQAEQMVAEGADILDVGGESSRPGHVPVSAEEEICRVVPVISSIKKTLGTAQTIAVDTVKSVVAEEALKAGASIVNDISALANDPHMGEVAARYGAQVVLMHNRAKATAVSYDAKIGGQYVAPEYANIIDDVTHELAERVEAALKAGIARDKIILDPGIGFGKTPQQNLTLIAQLGKIKALGFPVLIGPSRKSFIGHILDVAINDRIEGTAACVALAVMEGADIVRVHEVKYMARIAKMAAAIKEAR
ncbi:MAG TPA: dihydropteroate synthase [Smithella sp.]|nr:dihydropteroate synthase [Smithella sp.]